MKRKKRRAKAEPFESPVTVTVTVQCTCPKMCTARTQVIPCTRERGMSIRGMLARMIDVQKQVLDGLGIPRDTYVVSASAEGETVGVEFDEWLKHREDTTKKKR